MMMISDIYIYIYIHMYTHIHTHTYTLTQVMGIWGRAVRGFSGLRRCGGLNMFQWH